MFFSPTALGIAVIAAAAVALGAAAVLRFVRDRRMTRRRLPRWGVAGLVVGGLLATTAYQFAARYADDRRRIQFDAIAADWVANLRRAVDEGRQLCLFTSSLLSVAESIDDTQFHSFTDGALAQHAEIGAIAYYVVQSPGGADRAAELELRRIASNVRHRPGATLVTLLPASELAGDLVERGEWSASALIPDRSTGHHAFWLTRPVYRQDGAGGPIGLVAINYRLETLLANTEPTQFGELALALGAASDDGTTVVRVGDFGRHAERADDLELHVVLPVADRSWRVTVTPGVAARRDLLAGLPALVLAVGWLITMLAAWLLDDAERRHLEASHLAESRGRQLEASEQSFASIIDAAPEAVIVVTPAETRIVDVNPFAADWLGRTRLDLQGLRLEAVLAASEHQTPDEVLKRTLDPAHQTDRYVTFRRHDGALLDAEVTSATIVFRGLPAVVLMARDVSAIEQARRSAEAASRAKNQFLANVSHEIRTPLNGILGMSELALDGELAPATREHLETVHRCARELLLTIDDVLDFSQIEVGRLELIDEPFDVRALIDESIAHVAPRARAKGLTLIDIARRDLPESLIGDGPRVQKVLVNLLGNAIKFTAQGEVELRVQPEGMNDEDRLRVSFVVRDTGPGIPTALREKIFEPFQQLDGSFTRTQGGTGLGLALSRQVVRAMGGEIRLSSAMGQGSTFTVTVPLQVGNRGALPSRLPVLVGVPILVIHRSAAVQTSLSEALHTLGARVRVGGDYATAVSIADKARAQSTPFTTVFADRDWLRDPKLAAARARVEALLADGGCCYGIAVLPAEPDVNDGFPSLRLPLGFDHLRESITQLVNTDSSAQKPSAAALATAPHSILVVEDNPINRRLVVTLLQRRGYAVATAENGREAIDLLQARRFDAVLMDVQMPVLDGLMATRVIRNDLRLVDLPIIALTAHALAGDRDQCMAAGMDDYLTKPVQRDALYAVLERWILHADRLETKTPAPV